jgi:hypothetical protein
VLFLIPVFIVQETKLVQFTQYNTFSKIPPSTSMHFATRVRTWRVARLYSVQWNSSIWETVRNRTNVHIDYIFFCLEWPILWPPRILAFPLGTSCIGSRILDLDTSWKWVISFTPRPLYLLRKIPSYPFDRRLSGPQSRSIRHGEQKHLAPTGTRTPTPRPSSQ